MKKKSKMPTNAKMVDDFDAWLVNYVPEGLEKTPINIIRDITGEWRSLKNIYMDELMKWYNDSIELK